MKYIERAIAKYISHLQHTQNTLARVVAGNRTSGSHLSTLSKLHWLTVHDRIKFKIATMTHKAIHTGNPPYLAISGLVAHAMQNSMVCFCQPSVCCSL